MGKQTANTRIKGAVIVTRVSTTEQAESGTSLETQLDACRLKAAALGLPIINEYEDAGISGGFLTSRAGMMQALADIQQARADTLVCASLSRFSRDVEHQQAIKKAVESAGGRLVFCDMDFDDTPEGGLAFNIMGGFAQYERQVIRERTMRGRRKLAEQGVQTARGWSPYGYTLVKKSDVIRGDFAPELLGRYIVDETEAEVIRFLFSAYAAGEYSLPGLARELNKRGTPTKQGAAVWHPPTIRNFFLNEVYLGRPTFGKMTCRKTESRLSEIRPSTGEHYKSSEVRRPSDPEKIVTLSAPPLVDEDTWNRVQERLKTNKARRGGHPARVHVLSGSVKCEHCGGAMGYTANGNEKRGYPAYYQCCRYRQNKSYAEKDACVPTSYKVPVTEAAVVTAIESAVQHPEWIQDAQRLYRQDRPVTPHDEARRELQALDKALAGIVADEAAAVQGQIAGIRAGASPDAYAQVFSDLAARRKDMESRRGALAKAVRGRQKGETVPNAADVPARFLADTHRALTSLLLTEQERRQLVMQVVEKVHCKKDGAEVYFMPGLFDGDTLQHLSVSFLR